MSPNELGRGMHNDIGSMLKWSAQIGCGKGIVYNEWNSCLVGNIGNGSYVQHIPSRVADRFAIESACARTERTTIVFRVSTIHKNGIDTPCAQSQIKLSMCPAIEAT